MRPVRAHRLQNGRMDDNSSVALGQLPAPVLESQDGNGAASVRAKVLRDAVLPADIDLPVFQGAILGSVSMKTGFSSFSRSMVLLFADDIILCPDVAIPARRACSVPGMQSVADIDGELPAIHPGIR